LRSGRQAVEHAHALDINTDYRQLVDEFFSHYFGPLLAAWDEEDGHHVEFVMPGDFDDDGTSDGADFLYWQRNDGSEANLDLWQASFGDVASAMTASSTGVPEPTTGITLMLGVVVMLTRHGVVVSKPIPFLICANNPPLLT
jgi:hypothetical protein